MAESYPGARALIELHEKHLRSFVAVWRVAKTNQVVLPTTNDRAYRSLETLLLHVLDCASRYLGWTTAALELPPPVLPPLPEEGQVEGQADRLLEEILQAWRLPLADLPLKYFVSGTHPAWWGTPYCVDAMLEHAAMHPLRHEWQLKKLSKGAAV